jgi:hypothetical protein
MLEGFKELNNVITHFKVDNAIKKVSNYSSNNSEEENELDVIDRKAEKKDEEHDIKKYKEVDNLEDSGSDIELEAKEEKQNIDDNYLDNLMNGEDDNKQNTKKKIIKIFDTESNTIDIENNTKFKGTFGKKKNTK